MKTEIAVATVSGKAYYLLVNELKRRNMLFLSLTPDDNIPVDVKAVITTEKERPRIAHSNVLEYTECRSPAEVVDEAIRIIKGKKVYDVLAIGVDPGQNFGLAIIGDGAVLETKNCIGLVETVKAIEDALSRIPANRASVRIGNGAPSHARELLRRLDSTIQEDVQIESVREEGTSQFLGNTSHRRGERDIISAIKIGQRRGQVLRRRRSR